MPTPSWFYLCLLGGLHCFLFLLIAVVLGQVDETASINGKLGQRCRRTTCIATTGWRWGAKMWGALTGLATHCRGRWRRLTNGARCLTEVGIQASFLSEVVDISVLRGVLFMSLDAKPEGQMVSSKLWRGKRYCNLVILPRITWIECSCCVLTALYCTLACRQPSHHILHSLGIQHPLWYMQWRVVYEMNKLDT